MSVAAKISVVLIVALGTFSFLMPKDGDRTALEKKRQKLLVDIETSNKILSETSMDKSKSLAHLQALQSKISKRNQLIESLSAETRLLISPEEEITLAYLRPLETENTLSYIFPCADISLRHFT